MKTYYHDPALNRLYEVHTCMRETFADVQRAAKQTGVTLRYVHAHWVNYRRQHDVFAAEIVLKRPEIRHPKYV